MSGLDDLFRKAAQSAKAEPKPEPLPVSAPASSSDSKPRSMPGFGGFKKPAQVAQQVEVKSEEVKPAPASETAAVESPQPVESIAGAFAKSSGFPDEVPATQITASGDTPPDRDVGDADESVQKFLSLLDGIHGLTPDPRLATDAIKGIMIELKNNRQYIKHVQPEDVRVMIRMMRENMGLAKIAKAETKAKRSVKKEGQLKDDLASLGIDLGGI